MLDRREMIINTALALGYSMSAAGLSALLEEPLQAQVTVANKKVAQAKYSFLSATQAPIVEALADVILPKTKTPGAVEVGAVAFVDRFVNSVFNDKDQNTFKAGLDQFIKASSKAGKTYDQLAASDQVTALKQLEAKTFGGKANSEDTVFYEKFKSLLITGYYQSKVIATEVLAYDPIPGKFKGDIPYDGKNWSVVK